MECRGLLLLSPAWHANARQRLESHAEGIAYWWRWLDPHWAHSLRTALRFFKAYASRSTLIGFRAPHCLARTSAKSSSVPGDNTSFTKLFAPTALFFFPVTVAPAHCGFRRAAGSTAE